MPIEPMSSSGLRPISVDRWRSRSACVTMLMIEVMTVMMSESFSLKPTACHSDVGVVEDHVDADELLEHRQQRCRSRRSAAARTRALAGRCSDGASRAAAVSWISRDLRVDARRARARGCRTSVASRDPALGDQVARRLRDRQRQHAVDDGRGRPWPGTSTARPPARARASLLAPPAAVREEVVDEQRDEDAGDDRELLQRAQPAADARRRDLGDVGRRDHRGDADAEAADDADRRSASRRCRPEPVPDRTDEEQHRGDHA